MVAALPLHNPECASWTRLACTPFLTTGTCAAASCAQAPDPGIAQLIALCHTCTLALVSWGNITVSLRRHLQTVALVERAPAVLYRIRRYFALPSIPLALALRRRRLGQADLVLCLLKIGTRRARQFVERLIGKPIRVSRPAELHYRSNGAQPRIARVPRITSVVRENPCRRSTRFWSSFWEFRVGRTVAQLLARGVRRRELRLAVRRGWIVME